MIQAKKNDAWARSEWWEAHFHCKTPGYKYQEWLPRCRGARLVGAKPHEAHFRTGLHGHAALADDDLLPDRFRTRRLVDELTCFDLTR